jgi:hypothetical protein
MLDDSFILRDTLRSSTRPLQWHRLFRADLLKDLLNNTRGFLFTLPNLSIAVFLHLRCAFQFFDRGYQNPTDAGEVGNNTGQ